MCKAQFIDRMWLRIKGLAYFTASSFFDRTSCDHDIARKGHHALRRSQHENRIYFPSYASFSQGYSFQAFHVSF